MFKLVVQFAFSSGAIVLAGLILTRCADAIAERTGLGRVLVGSIFLAAATSLPEFLVDLSAVRQDMPNLAVGDLMGSSLFNLLILAVADLLHRNSGKMFSRTAAVHALSASMTISVTALASVAIFLGQMSKNLMIGRFGIGTIGIVVAYGLGVRLVYGDQKTSAAGKTTSEKSGRSLQSMTLRRAYGGYFVAVAILLIAAPLLASSAGEIAEISGLGKTFVGTALVALCTSLPELVSTIAAVRMGAFDLALGNIFGSNSFNMILLAPLDFVFEGSLFAAVSQAHVLTGLATILATSVAVMGQLYQVEKRRKFIEPDAFTIIGIVLGFLFLLYVIRDTTALAH